MAFPGVFLFLTCSHTCSHSHSHYTRHFPPNNLESYHVKLIPARYFPPKYYRLMRAREAFPAKISRKSIHLDSGLPDSQKNENKIFWNPKNWATKYLKRKSFIIVYSPIPKAFWSLFSLKSSMAIFWSSVSFLQCLEEKSWSGNWKASCLLRYFAPTEFNFGTFSSGKRLIYWWICCYERVSDVSSMLSSRIRKINSQKWRAGIVFKQCF